MRKNDKKEYIQSLCLLVFLDWAFSYLMYCSKYNANIKLGITIKLTLIGVCVILPLWGVLLLYSKKDKIDLNFTLYFGVSCLIYSLMLFWMYYNVMYKIVQVRSGVYFILGILGYLLTIISMSLYKIKIQQGKLVNKSGSPKYVVIGLIAIIGGNIFRAYMITKSEHIQDLVLGFSTLFLSYVFCIAITQIIDYYFLKKLAK